MLLMIRIPREWDYYFGWITTRVVVRKFWGYFIESFTSVILVDSKFDTNIDWYAMKN